MKAFAVIAVLAAASSAHADDADATYKEGAQLYAQKQYLAAASRFEASYKLDGDPAVLFNIAQAYRLGHACVQAARFYHEFLDKVPNPPERERLNQYMAEMDACAKAEQAAMKPTVIHDVVEKPVIITRPAPVTPTERKSPVVALAIGGAGVIALGVGAYFTYDVHAIARDRERVCPNQCLWATAQARADHLDDRGNRAVLGEAIAYGLGGAAVITAVALFVTRGNAESEHVVVAPTPGGASVGATWRF